MHSIYFMMKRITIKSLLEKPPVGDVVLVKGWVQTFRSNRFISLNDGSGANSLQVVVDFEQFPESLLRKITTGACISAKGELVESLGKRAGGGNIGCRTKHFGRS